MPKLHVTVRKAFGFGSSVMAMNGFDGQTMSFGLPADHHRHVARGHRRRRRPSSTTRSERLAVVWKSHSARPDGFHWLAPDGRQEFGPFETYDEALADMQAADEDSAAQPGATLQEAEDEIGIADWIDAETGEPPEGQSPPHLQEE